AGVASAQLTTAPTTKPAKLEVIRLVDQPDAWFTSEGKAIVDNILTWQNVNGGWWKAYNVEKPDPEFAEKNGKKSGHDSGFDNGATYSEMRVLARAYRVTQEAKYKDAFDRGLRFTLDSQFANGGWPQRLPLKQKNYSRQITFNDDAMVNVMRLL